MAAEVALTRRRPESPETDFAFEIDFKRGKGSPSRVFLAINDSVRGCEASRIRSLSATLIRCLRVGFD
jgi:hypothetical protein